MAESVSSSSALLDGLHNARDLGGLPLAEGGTVRSGVFFRSDALAALSDSGVAELAASPIGTVIDFRTDAERQAAPDRLPTSRVVHDRHLPILQGAVAEQAESLFDSGAPTAAAVAAALAAVPSLGDLYVQMLAGAMTEFAEVARLVARPEDPAHPGVLVHCTAGKDRTGIATALVLDAAGVERSAVIADYAVSQENLAGEWAQSMLDTLTAAGVPITPSVRTLATGTPPEAIRQALTWLDAEHGGAAGYLLAGGLSRTDLESLRLTLTR